MPFTPPDASPKATPVDKEQRLIVVSNRLPVTISKDDNGEYHFKVGRVHSFCTFAIFVIIVPQT